MKIKILGRRATCWKIEIFNILFSPRMQYYLSSDVWDLTDKGLDYKIIAIFGSQSSGKSTLLNGLFNTDFAVMNEDSRSQTTKGTPCIHGCGGSFLHNSFRDMAQQGTKRAFSHFGRGRDRRKRTWGRSSNQNI